MPDPNLQKAEADEAARFLRSLANPNRLLILCRLADGEMNVGNLSEPFELSQSSFSQHLSVLRKQGLIDYRKDGQTLYYSIIDGRVLEFINNLKEQFCPSAVN